MFVNQIDISLDAVFNTWLIVVFDLSTTVYTSEHPHKDAQRVGILCFHHADLYTWGHWCEFEACISFNF